jgi:hypothetical protein
VKVLNINLYLIRYGHQKKTTRLCDAQGWRQTDLANHGGASRIKTGKYEKANTGQKHPKI